MKKLAFLCFWLSSISAALSALQTPIDFNFYFNGSNAVQVAWNAYPGQSYVLQTATLLAGAAPVCDRLWSHAPTTNSSAAFAAVGGGLSQRNVGAPAMSNKLAIRGGNGSLPQNKPGDQTIAMNYL